MNVRLPVEVHRFQERVDLPSSFLWVVNVKSRSEPLPAERAFVNPSQFQVTL